MGEVRYLPPKVAEHDWLEPAAEAFEDAHQCWHHAADSYHDPRDFRRHVDSLIQSARNVTFRLQAAKKEGPESFSAWYEGDGEDSWRTFMKSYPEMVWLHNARTEITKRKGMSRTSIAVVSRIEGYFEPSKALMELPADTPTSEIVGKGIPTIPKKYRQHQAIEIVRRWEPEASQIANSFR